MSGAALDKVEAATTEEIRQRLLLGECIVCGTLACGGACIPENGVVDLFAGPGGWDVAGQWLGLPIVGVELDPAAALTRRAAGHVTVHASVTAVPLHVFATRGVRGLIASPPCQTFSRAGKGSGAKQLALLAEAVRKLGRGEWPQAEIDATHDPRTALVLEPLRWALALEPTWLAFEQVPGVLPVWEVMAEVLREHGWFVVTGIVHSEQHGVGQARERAVLLGHRERPVSLPTPTHSKYHRRDPRRLDAGVLPWVSMAECIGRGLVQRPSYTVVGGSAHGASGVEWGSAAVRQVLAEAAASGDADRWREHAYGLSDRPAPTVTGGGTDTGGAEPIAKLDRYTSRPTWIPRPAIEGETAADCAWVNERPSTTVVGSYHPEVVAAPGYRKAGDPPRQRTPRSVRITVQEAGVLQSFAADYPWQGNQGQQFQQAGNAVPPLLALALLGEVAF